MKNMAKRVQVLLLVLIIGAQQVMFSKTGSAGGSQTAQRPRAQGRVVAGAKRPAASQQKQTGRGRQPVASQKRASVQQPKPTAPILGTQQDFEKAAQQIQKFWNEYNLPSYEDQFVPGTIRQQSIALLKSKFKNLQQTINNTQNTVIIDSYAEILNNFNQKRSANFVNKNYVFQSLTQLLEMINMTAPENLEYKLSTVTTQQRQPQQQRFQQQQPQQFSQWQQWQQSQQGFQPQQQPQPGIITAPTASDLAALQISGQKAASGYFSPIADAYSWGRGKVASGWNYARDVASGVKGGFREFKEWVRPSKISLLESRARIDQLDKLRLKLQSEQRLNLADLNQLQMLESREEDDRAKVQKWWPYVIGFGALGVYAYNNPESVWNMISGTAGAVGTVAGAAVKGVGYGIGAAATATGAVGKAALSAASTPAGAIAGAGILGYNLFADDATPIEELTTGAHLETINQLLQYIPQLPVPIQQQLQSNGQTQLLVKLQQVLSQGAKLTPEQIQFVQGMQAFVNAQLSQQQQRPNLYPQ